MNIQSDILQGPAWGVKDAPERLIIFLHGYGANGHDLIGLAPELAKAIPNALFLSPDGIAPCEMAPFGRQWFPLGGWDPDNFDACLAVAARNIVPATKAVRSFIAEQLVAYQLKAKDCVLVGFSQGCMTALGVGLSAPQPLGGILGYSGLLAAKPTDEQVQAVKCLPICLVHGDMDAVVPHGALERALRQLNEAGMDNVEGYLLEGLGHGISPQGLSYGRQFLKRVLMGSSCGCGKAKCRA